MELEVRRKGLWGGKRFENFIWGVSAYVGSLGVSAPLGGVGGVGVRMIPGIPLYTVYTPKKEVCPSYI